MKQVFLKQILIFLLIAINGFAFSQEAVDLKYNFVKGKSYIQNTQITQNIIQTMGSQEMKILAEIKSGCEYSIENIDTEGNATIMVTISDLSMHTVMPGRDTTMNYKDLKDKKSIIFSKEGKLMSSVQVDSSDVTGSVNPKDLGKLKTLPGKLVKVGDKWQDKTVENRIPTKGSPFTMDITTDIEYTLVGKEIQNGKELYKISCSGPMSITGKGSQMGMEMFMEGTGKMEGFLYFDSKTSIVVFAEDNTEMNMNISISGPQNMTIPTTQSVRTVTSFEEKQ